MKQAGIITGARIDVSPKQLGYDVCCFIGIILKSAKDYPSALTKLESPEEVVEAYYTTGHYSVFIKVMCRSIDALQQVLINKIQTIDGSIYRNADLAAEPHYAHHRAVTRQIAYPHYPQVDPSRFTAYNAATLSEKVGIVGSWQTLL